MAAYVGPVVEMILRQRLSVVFASGQPKLQPNAALDVGSLRSGFQLKPLVQPSRWHVLYKAKRYRFCTLPTKNSRQGAQLGKLYLDWYVYASQKIVLAAGPGALGNLFEKPSQALDASHFV